MANGTKRIDGEPVFDTDRAWEQFEKRAAREPVPAFWRESEEGRRSNETGIEDRSDNNRNERQKDGSVGGKMAFQEATQRSPVVGVAEAASAATSGADGSWRTERPAKRRLRMVAAGVAAAVVAIGLIATPLGDRALAAMLQTFRIQHLVGIGITADDMATISGLLDRGSPDGERSFNLAQYGTLTQSGGGKARTVTWAEAEKRMGAPLLQLGNSADPTYQPATTLIFHLNVKAVNRLLTRLDSSTMLPAEADGKAIRLYMPDGIATEGSLAGKPVRLLQFGKPELTMEDGIDVATVREAVLGLPVLPDSLRTKLAAIDDWRSTLPVPAKDRSATSLRLGGRDAVMTEDGTKRYVLWLDGERMGLLSSEMKDFPTESAFRRAAEELVQP